MNEPTRWLTWLYGPEPLGLIWIGGHGDGFAGRTFTSIPDAVAYAEQLDQQGAGGVYHRLTTVTAIERGRGTAGDSAYLPGFAMDLDLLGPGHKALNYPETEQDLHELLHKAGLPDPTAWVHSGGGRYPFWKLEQPADLTLPGQLERAATLSKRLHKHVMAWAAELGWKVDNTSDLARVYRLPGTLNRKVPDAPELCQVTFVNGPTHSLEGLEYAIAQAPDPHPAAPEQSPFMTSRAASALFHDEFRGAQRAFTLEQALEFVRPALEQLRHAQDGEINNRLLSAALTLAHFGPEFWERDAAERQLYGALEHTVYDGATWQAANTIARAYADMNDHTGPEFWHAQFVRPTLEDPQPTGGRLRRSMLKRSEITNLPDPVPLIDGVIYRNSVVVISGKFGTYKSFIAVSMAASLATGQEWFGHHVPEAVPVIYAAAEGAYGIKRRLEAWESVHGPIPDSMYLIPISVRLNRPEDMRELEELIVETGAKVLIFDTMHASTPGVDENDAGQMGQVMDVLRGLQERHGMCSILPHHTGHAGERARGSSSVEDDADTTFVIKLRGEERGLDSVRTLVHRKTKDGPLLPDVDLKLVLVPDTGSGYVAPDTDAFREAEIGAQRPVDVGQEQTVQEPGEWTEKLTQPDAFVQRRILQVLRDVAGVTGRTEDKVLGLVAERWHGGKVGRERGQLNKQVFQRAWTAVVEMDMVVSGEAGPKSMIIDPDWLSARAQAEVTGE
jgi:hypothetical protein